MRAAGQYLNGCHVKESWTCNTSNSKTRTKGWKLKGKFWQNVKREFTISDLF